MMCIAELHIFMVTHTGLCCFNEGESEVQVVLQSVQIPWSCLCYFALLILTVYCYCQSETAGGAVM